MLDTALIFKIVGLGIILLVMDKILKAAGKEDYSAYTNIVGIIIILLAVLGVIKQLFEAVKTMFMF